MYTQPWWQRIFMGGAVAEAPSVMTAAGHKIERDGTVTVDNQNDAGVKQLRNSLSVIGSAAAGELAPIGYLWNGAKTGNRLTSFGRNLWRNGITNKYARDILIGSTIGLTADAAVKTFTPYNGVADGMLRSTFGEDIQQNPYYDYMLFGTELFNPVNLFAPASIASRFNLYRSFDNLGNEIDMFGKLKPSNKAIANYSNFQKNNPGIKVVRDITPEDVKLRFEDPEVTKIIDEAHNAVWTKNENGFLINYRPVDISKVRVLDDVALNGSDDLWLQDLSNTMEPGTVMLTGRIKDLRLNGNRVEPWFGWVPRYRYSRSYNASAERFLDEAIESASRNKDLESYVESLKNIRNQISDYQFDNFGNTIFADSDNNVRFSAYGKDMHINLPSSIVYRNGAWDAPTFMPLVIENLDPKNVIGLFDRYPFRRAIIDPYHRVHYTRGFGRYYMGSSAGNRPFNPENISVAPHIDFSQAGRDKLESYLRSVDSPDRIVLMGNVSGANNTIDLSKTPLSTFAPQRIGDYYHMVGIPSPRFEPAQFRPSGINSQYQWTPTADITVPKAPFYPISGTHKFHKLMDPEFNFIEVDPNLRDNFINFVESYPEENLPPAGNAPLSFLKNMYKEFGLGELPGRIIKKAEKIAAISAAETAASAPEVSLVDQMPRGYDIYYFRKGKPVGTLETSYDGYVDGLGKKFHASHIGMIKSLDPIERGVARSLYSSGLIYDDLFYKRLYPGTGGGLISGEVLLSPEQTIHTILKPNFSTRKFGNYGVHNFNSGDHVKIGDKAKPFTKHDGPVFHLTGTTDRIPVKSMNILHPQRIVFKDGKFSLIPLDLNNPSLYRSIAPIVGVGAGAAALSEGDK